MWHTAMSEQGATGKAADASGAAVATIIGLPPLSSHENLEKVEGSPAFPRGPDLRHELFVNNRWSIDI